MKNIYPLSNILPHASQYLDSDLTVIIDFKAMVFKKSGAVIDRPAIARSLYKIRWHSTFSRIPTNIQQTKALPRYTKYKQNALISCVIVDLLNKKNLQIECEMRFARLFYRFLQCQISSDIAELSCRMQEVGRSGPTTICYIENVLAALKRLCFSRKLQPQTIPRPQLQTPAKLLVH